MNIISLDEDHKKILEKIVVSENVPETIRKRAQILLCKAKGFTSEQVAEAIGVNRHTVNLWANRYRDRTGRESIDELLSVSAGRGKKGWLTKEEKAWILLIAGTSPKQLGRLYDVWDTKSLHHYITSHAKEAGLERLEAIGTKEIYRIVYRSRNRMWSEE